MSLTLCCQLSFNCCQLCNHCLKLLLGGHFFFWSSSGESPKWTLNPLEDETLTTAVWTLGSDQGAASAAPSCARGVATSAHVWVSWSGFAASTGVALLCSSDDSSNVDTSTDALHRELRYHERSFKQFKLSWHSFSPPGLCHRLEPRATCSSWAISNMTCCVHDETCWLTLWDTAHRNNFIAVVMCIYIYICVYLSTYLLIYSFLIYRVNVFCWCLLHVRCIPPSQFDKTVLSKCKFVSVSVCVRHHGRFVTLTPTRNYRRPPRHALGLATPASGALGKQHLEERSALECVGALEH